MGRYVTGRLRNAANFGTAVSVRGVTLARYSDAALDRRNSPPTFVHAIKRNQEGPSGSMASRLHQTRVAPAAPAIATRIACDEHYNWPPAGVARMRTSSFHPNWDCVSHGGSLYVERGVCFAAALVRATHCERKPAARLVR
ncbi:unnamed protein product, partial [Iphiclides podalirius]